LPAAEVRRRADYVLRAERVVCVSHFTKRQVVELLQIPNERCVAIPLAVGANFRPESEARKSALRRAKKLPQEFLLFVGRDRPNKNLDGLLAAYARTQLPMPLIIAGRQSSRTRRRLLALANDHQCVGSIRWVDTLRDEDLPTLLSCATALCMPSTFEGFGLPILEAMACGTPVVTSAGRATEEAAGGHAVLVDPESIDSLAEGLLRVQHVSAAQRQAARAYATQRSWNDVSRETLSVYLA
jgi:alpha-1,3-rhamnosyl/mannosyltransferase